MSWFRKRDPEPPAVRPSRAALPASPSASPVAVASRPSADPSLEIDLDSPDSLEVAPGGSVIALDTTVTGHVTTASDLFVAGQIDGNIESGAGVHVSGEGAINGGITALRVRIDAGGGVQGEIHANEVQIDGRVRGNVASNGRLELGERAEVIGDVRARTLFVEEGAQLQGRCMTSG